VNVFDWEETPELNITPLVDVMLVLLAILMVIAPNIVYEEMINLPRGSAQKQLEKKPPVSIVISKEGEISVNKTKYMNLASFLDSFVNESATFDKKTSVTISADRTLQYDTVMQVLSAVKRAGFSEVALATKG
jgi:biopolymer transport protein ExbD